jgi:hypothetical protein
VQIAELIMAMFSTMVLMEEKDIVAMVYAYYLSLRVNL